LARFCLFSRSGSQRRVHSCNRGLSLFPRKSWVGSESKNLVNSLFMNSLIKDSGMRQDTVKEGRLVDCRFTLVDRRWSGKRGSQ
jgi:hypothetical protein